MKQSPFARNLSALRSLAGRFFPARMNLTPVVRPVFVARAKATDRFAVEGEDIQRRILVDLLKKASRTEVGRRYHFGSMAIERDPYQEYRNRLAPVEYEDIRADVMKMVNGARNILWPGYVHDYAQSSGTSGGKSKYIPITAEGLRINHYQGAFDSVAHYLRLNPSSRLFSGKGFILGGSFANELHPKNPHVHVGDLSATLINSIPPGANIFRVPDKKTALMADWEEKLPALVAAAENVNVTNISGVPSWFLTVIKNICAHRGVDKISDVWPNLEVFFHGGISFEPYRDEYRALTDPSKMHFLETYNASEGFFAVQNDFGDPAMLLIVDAGVFFEFIPVDGGDPVPVWEVTKGKVYELLLTSVNGLWRYRVGDTVRIESVAPLKIRIAGRTKSYINAFGEELMEDNAERAIASACARTGASIVNYTAAPLFADNKHRGRHQWLIEWEKEPESIEGFAGILDTELRSLNSDYDAKRKHTIFLDPPEILTAERGVFDRWLRSAGNHKLGGQRKIPRLSNTRALMEAILALQS